MGRNSPRILQWNCRSLPANGPDLKARLTYNKPLQARPVALLLQETRCATYNITGYTGYYNPTITHKQGDTPQGQSAVYVRNDITSCQLDTSNYSTEAQEIVAARIVLPSKKGKTRTILLASVYMRPETGKSTLGNFDWISDWRNKYYADYIIIGGDFNARHRIWKYSTTSPRGNALQATMETYGFTLQNNLETPTRLGLHANQSDTIPDLTWTDGWPLHDWVVSEDTWGSDHYPIWITVDKPLPKPKRKLFKPQTGKHSELHQ